MPINKDGLDTSKQPTFSEIMRIELARKRNAKNAKPKTKTARKQKTEIVDSELPTIAEKKEAE